MISIIVPVYNMEKYLRECVDSILAQSYEDIEVILVDDGSKDASLDICREYEEKDSRVRVIHKENGGQGSARNMALDMASGEYVGFIDSDDWIERDMYAYLVGLLEENDADIACCDVLNVYEDGTVEGSSCPKETVVLSKYEALSHRLNGSGLVTDSPCNKLYKRELFFDLRYPENRLLEDTAVMYLLIDKSQRIVCGGKVGYNIRCDMSSVSRRKYNKRRCDTIITYTEMADFLSKKEEYKDYVSRANAYIAGAIFYNAGEMYCVDFEDKAQTQAYIKKAAAELLASGRELSFKNKVLLKLISISPKMYGFIYSKMKKA